MLCGFPKHMAVPFVGLQPFCAPNESIPERVTLRFDGNMSRIEALILCKACWPKKQRHAKTTIGPQVPKHMVQKIDPFVGVSMSIT